MSAKPVIFISYAHADEPDHPTDGEVKWLTFVQEYLQPAIKGGIFDLWVDREMEAGADWDPEIEAKLRACDIFILLVSARSMASHYIVDREIATIRKRQARGENVHFYPLLLTPTPTAGLKAVMDANLRPRDGKPLFGFSLNDRMQQMSDAADEIATIAEQVAAAKGAQHPSGPPAARPSNVHTSGLPETYYERLVGRDAELARLDAAWEAPDINILSLVAEGGAGKTALTVEWLKRLQAEGYRGAETVLGWSFYSQGTKERATSADTFLDWALKRLGLEVDTTSSAAKGEAIAEALMARRVLLLLDGVEPLQHGPDGQLGQLKDQGIRALLRRFAATAPGAGHGLVVLTSRLEVADIARWKDGAAPVLNLEQLSEAAGAALLRDNGVWGTDRELAEAVQDFGGHPLALGLLASFLRETQTGDLRRRDYIRAFLADAESPGHDHARRVMESYEREWLAGQAVLRAVLSMIGLFDRPANAGCLAALRAAPAIPGLTESIVDLDDAAWRRAVTRLRDLRLLSPPDPVEPDAIDAHPLVREWFGERLKQTSEAAWKSAHGRLFEHLRDTTEEGDSPTLEQLAPLYQAIAHGCRAGRHQEALDSVYMDRICRRGSDGEIVFYSQNFLGSYSYDLAALSWFFDKPYETPVATLGVAKQYWLHGVAALALRVHGRLAEALPADRTALRICESARQWRHAASVGYNLAEAELLEGEIATAIATAERSVEHADRSGNTFQMMVNRTTLADALHAAGQCEQAERLFADAERRQQEKRPEFPLLSSVWGYLYCDLLLGRGDYRPACDRATLTVEWVNDHPLSTALDKLTLGRARLGLALFGEKASPLRDQCGAARLAKRHLDQAINGLRAAGSTIHVPYGLLARTIYLRSIGEWSGAARDLDEVEEIAEPGPMRLFLSDLALDRARLALARGEAFSPLAGCIDGAPLQSEAPGDAERESLRAEAARQLEIAGDLIESCGYHRRDEELAELRAVLAGERSMASLPPRV